MLVKEKKSKSYVQLKEDCSRQGHACTECNVCYLEERIKPTEQTRPQAILLKNKQTTRNSCCSIWMLCVNSQIQQDPWYEKTLETFVRSKKNKANGKKLNFTTYKDLVHSWNVEDWSAYFTCSRLDRVCLLPPNPALFPATFSNTPLASGNYSMNMPCCFTFQSP